MFSVADLLRNVKLKLYIRKVKRYSLRKWLELSDIQNKIQEAADTKNLDGVYSGLMEYVSVALGNVPEMFWMDFYHLYAEIVNQNNIDDKYPILKTSSKKSEKRPWEYFGRSKYFWIHILAKNFGWSIEYILDLDINDAIALLQEIEIDEQLNKEFLWDTSEISYSYDGTSTKHVPLERPPWMVDNPVNKYMKRKRSKPPIEFMPVGNVQSINAET